MTYTGTSCRRRHRRHHRHRHQDVHLRGRLHLRDLLNTILCRWIFSLRLAMSCTRSLIHHEVQKLRSEKLQGREYKFSKISPSCQPSWRLWSRACGRSHSRSTFVVARPSAATTCTMAMLSRVLEIGVNSQALGAIFKTFVANVLARTHQLLEAIAFAHFKAPSIMRLQA